MVRVIRAGKDKGNKPRQGGGQQGGRESQGGSQKAGQGGGQQQGGREGQGGNGRPGQSGGQPGNREGQGERQDLAKSSNFVRNEGLATEGQDVRQEQGGSRDPGEYEYKGGRTGHRAGTPNPDDSRRSASPPAASVAAPQNRSLG